MSPPFPARRLRLFCGFLRFFASLPPSPILFSFPLSSSSFPSSLQSSLMSPFPSPFPSGVRLRVPTPVAVAVPAPSPLPSPFPSCAPSFAPFPLPLRPRPLDRPRPRHRLRSHPRLQPRPRPRSLLPAPRIRLPPRHDALVPTPECFNDCGGRGCDDSVPGDIPKTTPSGHRATGSPTWSASLPKIQLISRGGWSNKSSGGTILVPSPSKTGTILLHPLPPPIVE